MSTTEDFIAGTPGVYPGIAADLYHSLDACSASRLKALARSPLHCRHAIDHQDEDRDCFIRGTAAHACVLEPEKFAAGYAVGPNVDLRTKTGKASWDDFVEENPGKVHLRGKDGEKLIGIHAAVWAHPAAARALSADGACESSVVWETAALLCKLRADKLTADVCWDIKTTTDASPEGFAWAIRKYRYDVQAAHYLRGLAAAGTPVEGFGFIAVESDPPHAVGVYMLDDADLIEADEEAMELLARYAGCKRAGRWDGYGDNLNVLKLPPRRRGALVEV